MSKAAHVGAATALLLILGACGGGGDRPAAEADSGLTEPDSSAVLYDQLPAELRDRGEIVFAVDSHPPYRTVESDGRTVTGIDPELQAALSQVLGLPVRTEIADGLPQMISGMLAGRYDAFNGPVSATPERLADFDGVSWLTSRTSYLIPADSDIDAEDTAGLCGTTTAGTSGSIVEDQTAKLSEWCREQGREPVAFIPLSDTNSTILAVGSGRADTAATTQTGALDVMAEQEGEWRYVTQTDEQGAGIDQLVLLTPKSAEMGEVMLQAFEQIFADGTYEEIIDRWGLGDVAVEAPELNPEVAEQ